MGLTLENGKAVSIQKYVPAEALPEKALVLEPLPQLEGCIPSNWKDFVYGEDGTGTP